jgi:hypothetical protein
MGANPAKFFPWPTPYGQSPDANILSQAQAPPQAPTPQPVPPTPAPPTPQPPPPAPAPPEPQPQPFFNRGILNRYRRGVDDGEGIDYNPARRVRELME